MAQKCQSVGSSVTKGTAPQIWGVLHAVLNHFQHSLSCKDHSKIFSFLVTYCNCRKNVNFFMSTTIDSLRSLKQVENLHYCEVQTAALSVTPPCYWICVRRYLENFEGSVWASYWHHKAEAQVWLGERQFLRGAKLYWLRSPNQQNDFLHKVLLNFLQTWNSKIHTLIHNQLHSVQNFETQQLYQFKIKFR